MGRSPSVSHLDMPSWWRTPFSLCKPSILCGETLDGVRLVDSSETNLIRYRNESMQESRHQNFFLMILRVSVADRLHRLFRNNSSVLLILFTFLHVLLKQG